MLRYFYLIIVIFFYISCPAQKQDRIWLFGNHGGIDFNDLTNLTSFYSPFNGNLIKYSVGSISDFNGQLLFYAAADQFLALGIDIFNKTGSIMLNGDKLQGHPAQSQGIVVLPFPGDSTKFYVFHKSQSTGKNFIYYSIVDMTMDGGLGAVTSKNIVIPCDSLTQRTTAVKHANGRDWWLVQLRWDQPEYITFLITPDSIIGPYKFLVNDPSPKQNIVGTSRFSRSGSKLVSVGVYGSVDIMDFDRCTGAISNFQRIGENIFSYENSYLGCEFSPNENVLYVANTYPDPSKYVYQYDLTVPDIKASKKIIQMYPDTGLLQYIQFGHLLLGPDDRIYVSKGNGSGINSNTVYTQNIDVILNPDVLGSGCDYQSNFFYLNGGHTTYGLPNLVNYNLGPVAGSICDSLKTGTSEAHITKSPFTISPNPVNECIYIYQSRQVHTGKSYKVSIFDIQGQIVIEKEMHVGNFSVPVSDLAGGVYVMKIKCPDGIFSHRFLKMNTSFQ